jgi:hypothetical protein
MCSAYLASSGGGSAPQRAGNCPQVLAAKVLTHRLHSHRRAWASLPLSWPADCDLSGWQTPEQITTTCRSFGTARRLAVGNGALCLFCAVRPCDGHRIAPSASWGLAGTHNTAGREAIVELHGLIEHTDETAESQLWPAGALSEASRKQPGAARSRAAQQQTFTVARCVSSQHET